MMRIARQTCLFLAALWLAIQSATVEAGDLRTPWAALPDDAKLVTDPAALAALFAGRTVRGLYLPQGSAWRECTAADGRTIWEFDECLHPGTWRVSGSVLCYQYPSWDEGRQQCFVVYQSARLTHFAWLDPATGDQVLISNALEIVDGNPDHLPLDGAPICGDPSV